MPGRREIPQRDGDISEAVRSGQMAMFDLAARKHGLTLKRLHLETDIPEGTLRGWIAGTSMMPLDGLIKLARVPGFPNTLLSLPFEPAGKALCDAEQDEADLDDAALAAVALLNRYVAARHPASPSGIRIDHTERPDLKLAARNCADRAANAA